MSRILGVLLAPFKFIGSVIVAIIVALGWSKGEKEEGDQ